MIIEERLAYCVDMFIELIKANGDGTIEIEGTKYKVKTLLTVLDLRNKLIEWIRKDDAQWQIILRFFSDSYFFVTAQSDDVPNFERAY